MDAAIKNESIDANNYEKLMHLINEDFDDAMNDRKVVRNADPEDVVDLLNKMYYHLIVTKALIDEYISVAYRQLMHCSSDQDAVIFTEGALELAKKVCEYITMVFSERWDVWESDINRNRTKITNMISAIDDLYEDYHNVKGWLNSESERIAIIHGLSTNICNAMASANTRSDDKKGE